MQVPTISVFVFYIHAGLPGKHVNVVYCINFVIQINVCIYALCDLSNVLSGKFCWVYKLGMFTRVYIHITCVSLEYYDSFQISGKVKDLLIVKTVCYGGIHSNVNQTAN